MSYTLYSGAKLQLNQLKLVIDPPEGENTSYSDNPLLDVTCMERDVR